MPDTSTVDNALHKLYKSSKPWTQQKETARLLVLSVLPDTYIYVDCVS